MYCLFTGPAATWARNNQMMDDMVQNVTNDPKGYCQFMTAHDVSFIRTEAGFKYEPASGTIGLIQCIKDALGESLPIVINNMKYKNIKLSMKIANASPYYGKKEYLLYSDNIRNIKMKQLQEDICNSVNDKF